ncbi:MAG TPA: hypothetical protein VFF21_02275 [Flavobacteriaceae bacterium]|nr:hypothetical protein [Flavobacteriaceae bacterium]
MKFTHRLLYFSGGFFIGIIILLFILSGKKTSCDYGPQARTLKHLRLKPRTFSEESLLFFQQQALDTAQINDFLLTGKVDFSNSIIHTDSCKLYKVKGNISRKKIQVAISFCDDYAKIMTAELLP